MNPRILLLLSIFFISACSGEKKSTFKELFTLKAIVDNANKPLPNPTQACQNSMTAMQTCAATSTEFASVTLTEAILSSTISSKQFTTYTDYCNNIVNSESTKNQSNSLKECFFKCDTSYWQTRRNLNICSDSFTVMLTGSFNDSGTTNCKRNCLTPTNNNP